jgi:tRNA uridine 5-carboxymethylaminomethyl modification enzyme
VGAGHAGCEAAGAAANMGSKVLLITMNMMNMAQMSCNPSMGGIAKGQIVREIDALGGYSGIVTDDTMIQFRMLNRSKGPAMWSPRAQNDRQLFSQKWREILEKNVNIDFWQDSVIDLVIKNDCVQGVITSIGLEFYSKAVVLANGTFLNGTIYVGEKKFSGGRMGERASLDLTGNLIKYGFVSNRMKTGTPTRVDGRSLNFNLMEEQPGDVNPSKFSFTKTASLTTQRSCYLTYTNCEVHDLLRTGFDRSPMYSGRIIGRGPRYCPSIEDKIDRFASRNRHQLFIEPEGWNTVEYYVNGFSSSLPHEIQFDALRKVKGFENAKFFRPGYAIEYDYFPPDQLSFNLETKVIANLFFAGQINGTTGYEEAAAQGLMAGINAHLRINGLEPFILKRSEAYIGVLIDDLITKGTEEPYRMFTSRAEYRLLLRQDDADRRLSPLGYDLGLIPRERLSAVESKYQEVARLIAFLKVENLNPDRLNPILERNNSAIVSQKQKAANVLLRPQISIHDLIGEFEEIEDFIDTGLDGRMEIFEEAEILIKYENYLKKEQELADKMASMENLAIRNDFNYSEITSLSIEAKEKLTKVKPLTLGQASRISGVSPADIAVLIVYLGR